MKIPILLTIVLLLITSDFLNAQNNHIKQQNFTAFNREVSYEDGIAYLDAKAEDGLLWLKNANFKNGTIELEVKGRNIPGRSFVGIAFHGQDNQTFDAIYFRPFNFKNPSRNTHSIQYIAMPTNDWSTLRKAFPGKYENTITPIPDAVDDWFHVKIMVDHPQVKVFINGSDKPALEVVQISDRKQGKLGFWVGNGSDGWFRNLKITKQ
ncbi:DUF1080 domain-containing protein [Fulvivirgaceae bacterium BMA10]|uniref:DUF1080 domain-containing protein n=1 Tax=Splendidivirga corallicola TaxID=3051826 RepID=A0ABT8KNI2_9BACT|nr:DUF1080 domain-containing protein [Fulvivirgaceae bacterium BMA10]